MPSSRRSIERTEPIFKATETFHDIHDAIDKLEDDLHGDSTSRSSIDSVSSVTLGELLHMKITYGNHIFALNLFTCLY